MPILLFINGKAAGQIEELIVESVRLGKVVVIDKMPRLHLEMNEASRFWGKDESRKWVNDRPYLRKRKGRA